MSKSKLMLTGDAAMRMYVDALQLPLIDTLVMHCSDGRQAETLDHWGVYETHQPTCEIQEGIEERVEVGCVLDLCNFH